ncbi:MAG: DUF2281 domain-containing protein [Luteolibacter sp.]|uniref:DUF2281 domain-containing protein n=1 Tax=Luteolibacter sp. TaxID=1962973 RepID=UPI0032651680
MRTLETDAEILRDGSVKLLSPLPDWLKPGRAHVWLLLDCTKETGGTPRAGSLKGFRMAADFDEPLEDFKEYME